MSVEVGDGPAERVVRATVGLLAAEGPGGVKARAVATASGTSTMAVYHHFGGVPELMSAVADHGYNELGRAFAALPATEDPIADLFTMALTTRRIARDNPHLYDLMFGLSTRATYRPTAGTQLSGHSPAFRRSYEHVIAACDRLVRSERVVPAPPHVVAAALWSFVHGYITLELADHFLEFDDPVQEVLIPMGVTFSVGLGDTQERAQASHEAAARRFAADAKRTSSSTGRAKKATSRRAAG